MGLRTPTPVITDRRYGAAIDIPAASTPPLGNPRCAVAAQRADYRVARLCQPCSTNLTRLTQPCHPSYPSLRLSGRCARGFQQAVQQIFHLPREDEVAVAEQLARTRLVQVLSLIH